MKVICTNNWLFSCSRSFGTQISSKKPRETTSSQRKVVEGETSETATFDTRFRGSVNLTCNDFAFERAKYHKPKFNCKDISTSYLVAIRLAGTDR